MSRQEQLSYEFGPFRLDAGERLLRREGATVPLQPKAFDTLLALVQRSGRLVEKDELMRVVWPDSFVEEVNLAANVSLLRKALGERGGGEKYIETVPKHGYRFVAPVREVSGGAPDGEQEADRPQTAGPTTAAVLDAPAPEGSAAAGHEGHAGVVAEPRRISRPLLAVLVLPLGVAAALFYFLKPAVPSAAPSVAPAAGSLAVLPFRTLNGEADEQYLGVGIADTLTTRLGNLRQLRVRPTSSVLRYAGDGQDAAAAGRALQTEAVLEGSIHRLGDRVRVTVRLVGVRDGATVWAETFDERFDDLLSLQDSISERVARALVLNLSRADRLQLTKRHTENAEAYRLYLMGRYVWNRRLGDVLRSREYFRQAVALDPNFALAHVGLADSYSMGPPPQPEAERAVRRALEIDDSLGEAHATLGFILMFQNWDWEGAERELRRAVELSPNYATAHHWLGVYLSLRGRPDEAKAAMRRALEIDPTSLIINADLGQLHYFAGEYEEAEAQCRKALEMDADFPVAHHYLYFVHLKTGRHGEAFEHWLKFHLGQKNVQGDEPSFRSVYAAGGMRAFWRERLDSERSNPQPPPMHMALFHTHLGDREQALRWLDRARERRDFLLPFVNVDPVYDDLRPDPRFREIVRRVGLAE